MLDFSTLAKMCESVTRTEGTLIKSRPCESVAGHEWVFRTALGEATRRRMPGLDEGLVEWARGVKESDESPLSGPIYVVRRGLFSSVCFTEEEASALVAASKLRLDASRKPGVAADPMDV